eukprot:6186203-Pleurochrysis_carterae.AAC.1
MDASERRMSRPAPFAVHGRQTRPPNDKTTTKASARARGRVNTPDANTPACKWAPVILFAVCSSQSA